MRARVDFKGKDVKIHGHSCHRAEGELDLEKGILWDPNPRINSIDPRDGRIGIHLASGLIVQFVEGKPAVEAPLPAAVADTLTPVEDEEPPRPARPVVHETGEPITPAAKRAAEARKAAEARRAVSPFGPIDDEAKGQAKKRLGE